MTGGWLIVALALLAFAVAAGPRKANATGCGLFEDGCTTDDATSSEAAAFPFEHELENVAYPSTGEGAASDGEVDSDTDWDHSGGDWEADSDNRWTVPLGLGVHCIDSVSATARIERSPFIRFCSACAKTVYVTGLCSLSALQTRLPPIIVAYSWDLMSNNRTSAPDASLNVIVAAPSTATPSPAASGAPFNAALPLATCTQPLRPSAIV